MCGIFCSISKNPISSSVSRDCFNNLKHRGPDSSSFISFPYLDYEICLGFHRLAIIDIENGEQPFTANRGNNKIYLLCNGEIYNYKQLIEKYNLTTTSDCQVILEMYLKNKTIYEIVEELDGEFAFVLLEIKEGEGKDNTKIDIFYGRDRFGIRSLFYHIDETGFYCASEMKGLPNKKGEQVQPRKVYNYNLYNESVYTYYHIGKKFELIVDNVYKKLRKSLENSVKLRLQSERKVGVLLSGGVDSSLICGIASKILAEDNLKLHTFSIGLEDDAPDIINARKVAEHIGSIHHEIIIPVETWLDSLKDVIKQIETYDITTIRASTPQYLLAKWISENSDCKVILNGDISDEICGSYLYFYNSPSSDDFHVECLKLLNQIHNYDVLRVDRTLTAFGLEARVPYGSHEYVDLYLSIDKNSRMPIKNKRMEKYILRRSFDEGDKSIIPLSVLYRQKDAFSDGCSNKRKSWYEYIQEYVDDKVTNEEFEKYGNVHKSKEALFYYKVFKEFYPDTNLNVEMWMPKWTSEHNNDPSARKLVSLVE